jgi:hypothetical protein
LVWEPTDDQRLVVSGSNQIITGRVDQFSAVLRIIKRSIFSPCSRSPVVQVRRTHSEHLTRIVEYAMSDVRESFATCDPTIVHHVLYGTVGEHPGHLAIFIAFADAQALSTAHDQGLCGRIRKALFRQLAEEGYPTEYLTPDQITFVSTEDIEVAHGPWPLFR